MANSTKKSSSSFGKECVVFGCSNQEYNPDGSRSKSHFFKFPSKNPARTIWCNLVKQQHGRDGFKVSQNTVICDQHLLKTEIYRPPGGARSRLKQGNILF